MTDSYYNNAADYAEACRRAAKRQGLQPALDLLPTLFDDVVLEQTGGFTMAISVPCHYGFVLVTFDDSDGPDEPWMVGYYPNDCDDLFEYEMASLDGLYDVIRRCQTEGTPWVQPS